MFLSEYIEYLQGVISRGGDMKLDPENITMFFSNDALERREERPDS